MKYILSLLLSISMISSYAQSVSDQLAVEEFEIGKTAAGAPIKATKYKTAFPIYRFNFDSNSKMLFLILRKVRNNVYKNTGYIIAFDIISKTIKWHKAIEDGHFEFSFSKDNILQKGNNNYSTCYDKETGMKKWSKGHDFYYTSPTDNYSISYRGNYINLNTGEIVEKRKFNGKYGWNDIESFNKENIIVACGGLHFINKSNGSGWDYDLITGSSDYTKEHIARTAAVAAVGVAIFALTGVGVIPTGEGPQSVTQECSYILIQDKHVYFASKNELICIDSNGKKKWGATLPADTAANSIIWANGDNIIMLNNAYGLLNGNPVWRGEPFLASFNAKSGIRSYFNVVEAEKYIISSLAINDTLLLHCGNFIHKYYIPSGTIVTSKKTENTQLTTYAYFIKPEDYFLKTSNHCESLQQKYPGDYFLESRNHNIIHISNDFLPLDTISARNIWVSYRKEENTNFIQNDGATILLENGDLKATLNSAYIKVAEKKLISISNDGFNIIEYSIKH